MFMNPFQQWLHFCAKQTSARRQLILDSRRHGLVRPPDHQTIALEISQAHGQHALGDAVDCPMKTFEAQRSVAQDSNNRNGPFITYP